MRWWIPLAVVGAIALGAGLAFFLAAVSGTRRPDERPTAEERHAGLASGPGDAPGGGSRWSEDNALAWNPAAFLAVGGLVGAIVGLAVLIELL